MQSRYKCLLVTLSICLIPACTIPSARPKSLTTTSQNTNSGIIGDVDGAKKPNSDSKESTIADSNLPVTSPQPEPKPDPNQAFDDASAVVTSKNLQSSAALALNPLKGFLPFQGTYPNFPHSMEFFYLPLVSVAKSASQWKVEIAIQNRGVAPFYYDWPLELGLGNATAIATSALFETFKIQSIAAGQTVTAKVILSQKNTESKSLYLRVINPLALGVPLRFSNTDQDKAVTGWLSLGHF